MSDRRLADAPPSLSTPYPYEQWPSKWRNGFCAAQRVCGAAMRSADYERLRWIAGRLDNVKLKRIRRQPLCFNESVPTERFAPGFRVHGLTPVGPDTLVHAVFVDDRAEPALRPMEEVARLGRGPRVQYMAFVRQPTSVAQAEAQDAWTKRTGIDMVRIDGDALPPQARCVHHGLRRLIPRHSKLSYAAMLQPLLLWLLPSSVKLALMLDTDMVPLRPFDALLAHFATMRQKGAVMGLVPEQSRFYSTGVSMPAGVPGYNGGIELHDLESMRRSGTWGAVLDAFQAGLLMNRVGAGGEQNLYNGMAGLFPHLFHTLGCEWNRQTGSWGQKHHSLPADKRYGVARLDLELDAEVHACPAGCALLHLNSFKCAAVALRAAGGRCSAWRALLDRLERGEGHANSSGCPDEHTYKNKPGQGYQTGLGQYGLQERVTKRGGKAYTVVRLSPLDQGRALAAGWRKWFGSCCVP